MGNGPVETCLVYATSLQSGHVKASGQDGLNLLGPSTRARLIVTLETRKLLPRE